MTLEADARPRAPHFDWGATQYHLPVRLLPTIRKGKAVCSYCSQPTRVPILKSASEDGTREHSLVDSMARDNCLRLTASAVDESVAGSELWG